jgi:transposase-like protein
VKQIKSGNRRYSKTLKRKVAQDYLSGKFSYSVGADLYGLRNRGVVKEFVKWYRKTEQIEMMAEQSSKEVNSELFEKLDSQIDIDELAAKLAAAHLKIAGLETLIEVAEKELKIDIRKKSGTKQ